jgi:hypothetical protein
VECLARNALLIHWSSQNLTTHTRKEDKLESWMPYKIHFGIVKVKVLTTLREEENHHGPMPQVGKGNCLALELVKRLGLNDILRLTP